MPDGCFIDLLCCSETLWQTCALSSCFTGLISSSVVGSDCCTSSQNRCYLVPWLALLGTLVITCRDVSSLKSLFAEKLQRREGSRGCPSPHNFGDEMGFGQSFVLMVHSCFMPRTFLQAKKKWLASIMSTRHVAAKRLELLVTWSISFC